MYVCRQENDKHPMNDHFKEFEKKDPRIFGAFFFFLPVEWNSR